MVSNFSCAQIKGWNLAYIMILSKVHIAKTNHLGYGRFSGDLICSRRMSQVQNQTYPMNSNDPIHLVLNCFPTICPIGVAPPKDPYQKNSTITIANFSASEAIASISASTPKKSPLIFFGCGKSSRFFFPFTEVKVPGLQLPSAVARGLVHLATHL